MNNREIFAELVAALEADGRTALGTVIATRGSTPQKVGAKLLIKADGQSSSGTLGGGCVESQVWQEAIRALAAGGARLATYELSDDYAGDNGMICGGTMDIMVDIWTETDLELARRASAELAVGRPCVLASVIDGDEIGKKALIGTARGERWAIDTNATALAEAMREALHDGGVLGLQETAVIDLPGAKVFAENLRGQAELIIVGAGHVAQALCQVASFAGFAVTVLDNREKFASAERFPGATQVLAAEVEETLPRLPIGANTYVVIVTRGHQFDEGALRLVLDSPAAYIGMIGSRRKVLLVYKRMMADGYDAARLQQVYAPLGLEIGAETVEEIAVSVVAELIKVRRRGNEAAVGHMKDELKIKELGIGCSGADDSLQQYLCPS